MKKLDFAMKKNIWIIAVLTASCLLFAADVRTAFDHSADFSRYPTHSWFKAEAGISLWTDRFQEDVDGELSAKGWSRVPSGDDASVASLGFTKNEQTLQTFYDEFGGGSFWRGFGPGLATTTVKNTRSEL